MWNFFISDFLGCSGDTIPVFGDTIPISGAQFRGQQFQQFRGQQFQQFPAVPGTPYLILRS